MDMRACCIHPRLCQRWHTKAAEKGAAQQARNSITVTFMTTTGGGVA